jgi:aminoglycoside phosphotransferase (APT) family kinase protein
VPAGPIASGLGRGERLPAVLGCPRLGDVPDVGPLLASGRDCDIFELGPDLVMRRSKTGRSLEREAHAMRYAAAHGYPVPAVHDVLDDGREVVIERIRGPMMMDVMTRRPHRLSSFAAMLADLHDQLHEIVGPDWLPAWGGAGDRLMHGDLHPMNVMMTGRGPVVIDWANAGRGDALSDVAVTYVLLTCPVVPAPAVVRAIAGPLRALLARRFVSRYRGRDLDACIAEMAARKAHDANFSPEESARCRALSARAARRATRGADSLG